jgi:hypothetical protein
MTTEAALRHRLAKAEWLDSDIDGLVWRAIVARRVIVVEVERYGSGWAARCGVVDVRMPDQHRTVIVGEAHAPTFERAVGEAKRMRARIESQIEAMLLDLSTRADVAPEKDHVINLTGLRGVGPWVGEGPTAALHMAHEIRDAYHAPGAVALDLAEDYRRQYPDAKTFRVGPRKRRS